MLNLDKISDAVANPTRLSILNDSITFDVKPVTTASFSTCETAARRRVDKLSNLAKDIDHLEASFEVVGFDLTDEKQLEGAHYLFFIPELACRHLVSWSGVTIGEDDKDAEPNRENIEMAMSHHIIGKLFYQELTKDMMLKFASKKDLGIDVSGTSATVPNTAKPAEK
jgi:NADP-dependent 3-hydroxy acid dehydrogenase YdfG